MHIQAHHHPGGELFTFSAIREHIARAECERIARAEYDNITRYRSATA